MEARSSLAIRGHEEEQKMPSAIPTDQWKVTFSRFVNYPSLPSTCPSLIPLPHNRHSRPPRGTWISSASATASLQLLNYQSNSKDAILGLSLNDTILEEHYVWKLHFSWPQVSCVSGYPARGTRAVFVSFKDSLGEIQKFGFRFSTISETEAFICALKVIWEDPIETKCLDSNFQSAISSQSVFMPPDGYKPRAWVEEESSTMNPVEDYSPQLQLSWNNEAEQTSFSTEKSPNHNNEGISPAMPPSFTSLLRDCYSEIKQGQPSSSHDTDLKSQIMKYMEDSSFHDMLSKVEKVIDELGDDLLLAPRIHDPHRSPQATKSHVQSDLIPKSFWIAIIHRSASVSNSLSCIAIGSDLVMAGAASALFLLDIKGRVLVWRDYRGDVSAVQAERFFTKLIEKEGDPQSQDPVVYDNGVSYMYIQHSNVYLMTASRQNCNAASLLSFLHRVVDVFKHYFEELEEESLRDNFVVVYELLDEMMDFGYPQYTEAKILSEFIKTDAYRMETSQRPPMAVTNAVSWRSEGINYKKNEVFLDVVESVNILVNSNGQVIRSDVVGALKMRTYLSGMPECKLGLNDRVLLEAQGRATKGKAIDLEDIKFHQCVRLAKFENDRTISFIPPDGAFDLMTYRLSTQVKPLIWVEAQVEMHSRSRVEMMVKARSQFKERSTATNVEIELPVAIDASNPNIRTSMGSASYAPENDALLWKIKSFPGGKEYMLRAEFSLPSITAEEATPERKAPIRVKFEIPYFTVSGIQVRYLKIIEKSGYQALPWVRYITMAGEVICWGRLGLQDWRSK
uniref:MHD domain-containing protein n=2 Tax=Salix viminalis TaxID=40686 RepID=A0A6N2N3D1_SALVM